MRRGILSIDNYKIKILISSKNVAERLGRRLIVKVLTTEVQVPQSDVQMSQVAKQPPEFQLWKVDPKSKQATGGAMSLSFGFD